MGGGGRVAAGRRRAGGLVGGGGGSRAGRASHRAPRCRGRQRSVRRGRGRPTAWTVSQPHTQPHSRTGWLAGHAGGSGLPRPPTRISSEPPICLPSTSVPQPPRRPTAACPLCPRVLPPPLLCLSVHPTATSSSGYGDYAPTTPITQVGCWLFVGRLVVSRPVGQALRGGWMVACGSCARAPIPSCRHAGATMHMHVPCAVRACLHVPRLP